MVASESGLDRHVTLKNGLHHHHPTSLSLPFSLHTTRTTTILIQAQRFKVGNSSVLTQRLGLWRMAAIAAERAGGVGSGCAQRCKERQPRSWWRHEQRSFAAALVSASHHSAQGDERLVSRNALRRHKNTRAGGGRLGVLKDPKPPWVEAVTVGYVAAGAPLLVVLTLRGDDGVDSTTVSFLLRRALVPLNSSEDAGWPRWIGLPPR